MHAITMDMVGVKKNIIKKKDNIKKLKVVYISSPVKFKTSASGFRSLVQELTGRNSDITRYHHHHHHDATNNYEFDPLMATATTQLAGLVDENPKPVGLAQQGELFTDSDSFDLDDVKFSSEMVDQYLAGICTRPSYSLHDQV